MNSLVQFFITVFKILTDYTVFEIPLLVWLILPAIISIVVKFIQGKK